MYRIDSIIRLVNQIKNLNGHPVKQRALSVFDIQGEAVLKRPKVLWEAQAKKHGANLDRVQVWDAFSELFLDSYRNEAELQWLGEIIADSPFSFEELAHILLFEVTPVCGGNLFEWPGGEWDLFSPDWLIEECLLRQNKRPFKSCGDPDKVTFLIHLLGFGSTCEAYLLLYRVRRIRCAR